MFCTLLYQHDSASRVRNEDIGVVGKYSICTYNGWIFLRIQCRNFIATWSKFQSCLGGLADLWIGGLADWWMGGLVDWWTGGLADWRTGGLADWLTGGLVDWLTD